MKEHAYSAKSLQDFFQSNNEHDVLTQIQFPYTRMFDFIHEELSGAIDELNLHKVKPYADRIYASVVGGYDAFMPVSIQRQRFVSI